MHTRMPAHNATLHLADLPAWFYYQRPANLLPHDLTRRMDILPPLNFRSLLGLGMKFIPRPRHTTSTILEKSFTRLCKDLFNRCVYADGDNEYDPYLYASSNHLPPEKLVPLELKRRIDSFTSALCTTFTK